MGNGQVNKFDPKDLLKYKALIFDLDGTLVDLGVDWSTLKKELSKHFFSKTGENLEFSPLNQKLFYVKDNFEKKVFSELINIISSFETKVENYKINKTLLNIINENEIKFAIYSMNTEKCISGFINNFLKKRPSIIVSKENCFEPKPTNLDLDRIISFWQINKEDVIFVGNSNEDEESAKKSQIKFLKI